MLRFIHNYTLGNPHLQSPFTNYIIKALRMHHLDLTYLYTSLRDNKKLRENRFMQDLFKKEVYRRNNHITGGSALKTKEISFFGERKNYDGT